ncbi:MAG: hypothetical protein ACJA2S_005436 [Cyclobacteriaceae bacterium]|jgi:hypothetical protein
MVMKKLVFVIGVLVFCLSSTLEAQEKFLEISGVISDKSTKKPIQACNVYVRNKDFGTVANSKGEFSIKIPREYQGSNLVFSNIGYRTVEIDISELTSEDNIISLVPTTIIMEELVVREAETILREAIGRIPENYPENHEMLTTFYRETIKKNNSYVDISQGILDVFKLPYQKAGRDQVKINKGFRSQDYKTQDTLVFKIMGGPNTMLLLDLIKNPGLILSSDILEYYKYELTDIREMDGQKHYEISFIPKDTRDPQLYIGKIFIEQKTLAISEIKFGFSPETVKIAGRNLVKDKPRLAKLTTLKVEYEIKYREYKGRWYLYYVKNELAMRCNWKKKLFNSTFHSISEMVITDRELMNVRPFEKEHRAAKYLVFSEEAGKHYDDSFWEDYTIIKPEDDIRKALAKISSKRL